MAAELKDVLVTGGAGYAGSLLCPQLLASGYKVTVYDTCWFGSDFLPHDNPDFKLRLRFAGPNMDQINGGRIYFNNVSLIGSPLQPLGIKYNSQTVFGFYPNPFTDRVYLNHAFGTVA